ncbi:hypothetical protein [Bradyrhizobium liaoningense]|uniref:hypothetical protein n=1 Tax=Bradyrhizobium liaoningense TaxID=43992 RepID=UPI001BA8E59D|nr:hypothetical protein [Bradyrhizobium liaoningense]MBR0855446.1 hypothetical protein [Bradyrhizobium liaoningense]
MTEIPKLDDLPPHAKAYLDELRAAFRISMNLALKLGEERGLSREEKAVAITMTTIRCAALAIIGGGLAASDFEGMLGELVTDLGKSLEERRRLQ